MWLMLQSWCTLRVAVGAMVACGRCVRCVHVCVVCVLRVCGCVRCVRSCGVVVAIACAVLLCVALCAVVRVPFAVRDKRGGWRALRCVGCCVCMCARVCAFALLRVALVAVACVMCASVVARVSDAMVLFQSLREARLYPVLWCVAA